MEVIMMTVTDPVEEVMVPVEEVVVEGIRSERGTGSALSLNVE